MGGRTVRDISLEVITVPTLRDLRRRLPQLLVGILVLGVGIALTLEARLGVSPYDVLHQGIARRTGLSVGTVVILVGLVILLFWIPLRQRPGIGTVLNTLTVGLVIDLVLRIVPEPDLVSARIPLLLIGILVTGLGMGLYIGAGLGPGPRDGLMTGIAAKGFPLWAVRTVLELTALAAGWVLGGNVGVGTVLFAFSIGPLGHFFLRHLHLGASEAPAEFAPGTVGE
ncbi:MAG TPA: hypothetical protein VKI01_09915 [Acidimicrobiia bacterium]|nr:hypothetical protein [Acidimicrobiia bacterium]